MSSDPRNTATCDKLRFLHSDFCKIDNVKEEHKELCEKLLDTINTENCPECPNPRPTYNQRTKIAPEGCGIGIFTVKG